ncbi:MAG TPA: TIGR03435 family protein [Gammaproteobacteria bacterium]|nr:TIGR03435 family protein [Gammaproteobacteria bacterium]
MLELLVRRVGVSRAAAIAVVLVSAHGSPAAGQRSIGEGPLKAFESASVQPSHPAAEKLLKVEPRTGNFAASNASLAELVAFAYDVRTDQIVDLPAWAAAPRYQVEARAPKDLAGRHGQPLVEDVRPLVAGLLVDYFSLDAHRIQSPIYYLLDQADGGVRLRDSADQWAAPGFLAPSGAGFAGQRVRTRDIGTALEPLVGRPVIDHTGLYTRYDVDFRWDTHERDAQKLTAELERQLGLTLRVVQVELLIVDRATELKSGVN